MPIFNKDIITLEGIIDFLVGMCRTRKRNRMLAINIA
jgi:hypothetical protein